MEFTWERMIPEINEGEVVWAEHYARYIFSSFFVKGKVVFRCRLWEWLRFPLSSRKRS